MDADDPTWSVNQPTFLSCRVEQSGREAAWLRISGELDLATCWYVSGQLERLFARARLIVVDLSDLTFLDAAGIAALVAADARARGRARRLVIVRVPRQVERLWKIAGLPDGLALSYSELTLET